MEAPIKLRAEGSEGAAEGSRELGRLKGLSGPEASLDPRAPNTTHKTDH